MCSTNPLACFMSSFSSSSDAAADPGEAFRETEEKSLLPVALEGVGVSLTPNLLVCFPKEMDDCEKTMEGWNSLQSLIQIIGSIHLPRTVLLANFGGVQCKQSCTSFRRSKILLPSFRLPIVANYE